MPQTRKNGPRLTTADRPLTTNTPAAEQAMPATKLTRNNDTGVPVDASVLAAAAALLAGQHEAERQAYDLGRLAGFADGWRCGLEAAAERRSAA